MRRSRRSSHCNGIMCRCVRCKSIMRDGSSTANRLARRLGIVGWIVVLVLGVTLAMEGPQPQMLAPHPKAVKNIHAPGEVDRPEMVKFIVADPASLPGIVVDETAAELVGEWQYSTHTPPYVGLGYLHDMKAGKGTKSVTFTPTLPKSGWYEVRLAHCYN